MGGKRVKMSDDIVSLVIEKENWMNICYYVPWIKKSIDKIISEINMKINEIIRKYKSQVITPQNKLKEKTKNGGISC